MKTLSVALVFALLPLASCSGGDDNGTGTTAQAPTSDADESEAEPTQPVTTPESTVAATLPASTLAVIDTTVPEPTVPAYAAALGLDPIELLTPTEGGGDRPDLRWDPVDGAASYQVTVLDPDGRTYWGWTGAEASVPFGGLPSLSPDAAGPRIVPGMSWTVTAYDSDVAPIAIGGPRSLSP